MAKIPFTLDAWLKDKNQKIETAFGEPAKVVFTEGLGECPILAVIYDGDTTDSAWFTKDGRSQDGAYGLFIITPEPELSEFEKGCIRLYQDGRDDGFAGDNLSDENLKECSAKLLALAREQLIKDGYIIEKKAFHDAVEKVAPEVMKEVSDKVDMEEVLRLGYEKGKAEALKDLPRWRVSNAMRSTLPTVMYGDNGMILYKDGLEVPISDLEKLPGFNE